MQKDLSLIIDPDQHWNFRISDAGLVIPLSYTLSEVASPLEVIR